MKILLITNYWWPWNMSGSLRWLHIGEYLKFHVLTSLKPRKGFYDESLPLPHNHIVARIADNCPAVLFGLLVTPYLIWHRNRYEIFLFTIPPESLLIPAWILQKLGRKVVIDVRDNISRTNNTNKWRSLRWLWAWLYRRIPHKVAVNEVVEGCEAIIRHGYMDIDVFAGRNDWAFETVHDRLPYSYFKAMLRHGIIPDYRRRPKDRTPSTFYTLRKYFDNLPKHFTDERMYTWPLHSYRFIANQWESYLTKIY